MGRHKRSIGWTENPLKLQKFKRSDQADCGFSIVTWKSTALRETASWNLKIQDGGLNW